MREFLQTFMERKGGQASWVAGVGRFVKLSNKEKELSIG